MHTPRDLPTHLKLSEGSRSPKMQEGLKYERKYYHAKQKYFMLK